MVHDLSSHATTHATTKEYLPIILPIEDAHMKAAAASPAALAHLSLHALMHFLPSLQPVPPAHASQSAHFSSSHGTQGPFLK